MASNCHCSTSCPTKATTKPSSYHAITAVAGSLLCSSCCLIQLLFSFLGLGCAGFSKMEPFKPYARALTAAVLGHMLAKQGLNKRTALTILAASSIAISQELVSLHNQGMLLRTILEPLRMYGLLQPEHTNSHTGWHRLHADQEQVVSQHVTFRFHVREMKCEGCAMHLKGSLQRLPGVVNCTVDFHHKLVTITAEPTVDQRTLTSAITDVDRTYVPIPAAEPAGDQGGTGTAAETAAAAAAAVQAASKGQPKGPLSVGSQGNGEACPVSSAGVCDPREP